VKKDDKLLWLALAGLLLLLVWGKDIGAFSSITNPSVTKYSDSNIVSGVSVRLESSTYATSFKKVVSAEELQAALQSIQPVNAPVSISITSTGSSYFVRPSELQAITPEYHSIKSDKYSWLWSEADARADCMKRGAAGIKFFKSSGVLSDLSTYYCVFAEEKVPLYKINVPAGNKIVTYNYELSSAGKIELVSTHVSGSTIKTSGVNYIKVVNSEKPSYSAVQAFASSAYLVRQSGSTFELKGEDKTKHDAYDRLLASFDAPGYDVSRLNQDVAALNTAATALKTAQAIPILPEGVSSVSITPNGQVTIQLAGLFNPTGTEILLDQSFLSYAPVPQVKPAIGALNTFTLEKGASLQAALPVTNQGDAGNIQGSLDCGDKVTVSGQLVQTFTAGQTKDFTFTITSNTPGDYNCLFTASAGSNTAEKTFRVTVKDAAGGITIVDNGTQVTSCTSPVNITCLDKTEGTMVFYSGECKMSGDQPGCVYLNKTIEDNSTVTCNSAPLCDIKVISETQLSIPDCRNTATGRDCNYRTLTCKDGIDNTTMTCIIPPSEPWSNEKMAAVAIGLIVSVFGALALVQSMTGKRRKR